MADSEARPGPVDTGAQQADIVIETSQAAAKKAKAASSTDTAKPEPKPTEPAKVEEGKDHGESAGDPGEQQPDPDGEVPEGVKKKLGKLTRRVYEEREAAAREKARADQLTAELDKLRQGSAGVQAPPQPVVPAATPSDRPTLESCGHDPEKYLEALTEWKLDQRMSADAAKREQTARQEAAQKQLGTHKSREETFAEAHPDYYDKAYTAPINYSPAMLDFIKESDQGPQVAYYLADHLDEAKAIEALPPMRQAIALDRIERSIATPAPVVDQDDDAARPITPARTVTKAPPPPATVVPAGAQRRDPNDPGMSTADRIALWRRQKKRG